MIWLYAFLTMSTGLGFDPVYGVGIEGDWRPVDRVRIVAGTDYASSKKQYLDSGWSTSVSARMEYATGGPLLGLGASWSHNQTRTYTKDATNPFVLVGMTLEPGSRIYLNWSPDDGTQNQVNTMSFRWEYEKQRWAMNLSGGMEKFKDQQGVGRSGAFYGIQVSRRVR